MPCVSCFAFCGKQEARRPPKSDRDAVNEYLSANRQAEAIASDGLYPRRQTMT